MSSRMSNEKSYVGVLLALACSGIATVAHSGEIAHYDFGTKGVFNSAFHYEDVSGNGHHGKEFGTYYNLDGRTDDGADMWRNVGGTRGGVYSYQWDSGVDYDSDALDNGVLGAGNWDNNRVNINGNSAIPDLAANAGLTFSLFVNPENVTFDGMARPHYGGRSAPNAVFAHLVGLGGYGDAPIMTIELDASLRVHGFVEGDGADTQSEITGTGSIAANEWTHIAITYDRLNNEAKTYINGVLDSTTDISGVGDGILVWSEAKLGGGFVTASPGPTTTTFMGQMDDVRIHDEVLPQAQIAALASLSSVMDGDSPDPASEELYRWYAPDSIQGAGNGVGIVEWSNKATSPIAAGDLDELPTHVDASPPILSAGLINGLDALSFDDAQGTRIWDSDGFLYQPNTVFFVTRVHNHAQTTEDLYDGMTSTNRHAQRVDGLFYAGEVEVFGDDMRDNQWHVNTWTFNGGNSLWHKDGLLHDSGNVGSQNWSGFMLGSDYDSELSGNTDSKDFDGDVAEILVYDGILAAADREAVEDYLLEKYDIRSSRVPLPEAPGDVVWTMVVLPDTQVYLKYPSTAGIFGEMTDWIVSNKTTRNIGLVLHEGDIVNRNDSNEDDQTAEQQWENAQDAMFRLNGEVPYILSTGNHDHGFRDAESRDTHFNEYFSSTNNPLNDPAQGGILKGLMVSNELQNAYYEYVAPDGREFLFFSLEWGPRTSVVAWAESIAGNPEYASHTAALLTHAYLHFDESRYDRSQDVDSDGNNDRQWNPHTYDTAPDTSDGQELWDNLVKLNGNFAMTFNGHVLGDGTGYLVSTGEQGNAVHQMLFNRQFRPNGGNGWLRLLEFMSDGKTVQVRTYSPFLDQWETDPANQFTFQLDVPPIGDISVGHLGASELALTWNTSAPYSYTLLKKTDLTNSTWSTNQSGIPSGESSVTVTTAVDAAQAFYKVVSEQ